MKNFKRIAAMAAAMTLAACAAAPIASFADDTTTPPAKTIVIEDNGSIVASNHSFEAYQIFTGTLNSTSNGFSGNTVAFGANVTGESLVSNLKSAGITDTNAAAKIGALTSTSTAYVVAQAIESVPASEAAKLANAINDSLKAGVEADAKFDPKANVTTASMTVSADGYYFVKDTTTMPTEGNNALSAYIVRVIGSQSVKIKTDAPSLIKKIWHNDSAANATIDGSYPVRRDGAASGWNDVGDNQIGDTVDYFVETTVPDMKDYGYYKYKISDELSNGLTFKTDASTVKMYYYAAGETTGAAITVHVATTADANAATPEVVFSGQNLTIDFVDLKACLAANNITPAAGDKIITFYQATLNENALISASANDTQNNPNCAFLTYSNNPNKSGTGDLNGDGDTNDEGETPNDTGKTEKDFVWEWTYTFEAEKVDENNQPLPGANFSLYNADPDAQGSTATPMGVVEITDVANVKVNGLTALAADTRYFRPAKSGETTNVITNFSTLAGTPAVEENGEVITPAVPAKTKFVFVGLDDTKTYYLKENQAPTDYTKRADAVDVVISDTYDTVPSKNTAVTRTFDSNDGDIATVQNFKGSILPSTGGIGTYLFYGIGGALAVGAGMVLATKKRVNK